MSCNAADRFRFLPVYHADATRYWAKACEGLEPPDLAFGPEWRQPRPRVSEKYFLVWDDHHPAPGRPCGDGPVGLIWVTWPAATTARFGMGLWRECRGQGLGPLIRDAVYDFLFSDPVIHKLESEVYQSNQHSLGALHGRHARSAVEGRQVATIQVDGVFYDRLLFGLLRPAWEAQQGAEGTSNSRPATATPETMSD